MSSGDQDYTIPQVDSGVLADTGISVSAGVPGQVIYYPGSSHDHSAVEAEKEYWPPPMDPESFPLPAKFISARIKANGWTYIEGHHSSSGWHMRFRHPTSERTVLDVSYTGGSADPDGHHFETTVHSRAAGDSAEDLQKAVDNFSTLQF